MPFFVNLGNSILSTLCWPFVMTSAIVGIWFLAMIGPSIGNCGRPIVSSEF